MCRWIAYRGPTIALEDYVTQADRSLVAQSLAALESAASTNGDGFGLGWYGRHAEPGLYHETRPAWSDDNLKYLCRHLYSHLFFAHVRAATGTSITRENCHPFTSGQWMFMHNGFVGGWTRLRRRLEDLISDAHYPGRRGTTDSEALFLTMLSNPKRDPVEMVRCLIEAVCGLVNEPPYREPFRFTAALTNGADLFAFRFAENDEPNSLYYRETGSEILVVSEPLDKTTDWKAVLPNTALVALHGKSAEMQTLISNKQEEPQRHRPVKAR
jgi:glutamine amidotransferase